MRPLGESLELALHNAAGNYNYHRVQVVGYFAGVIPSRPVLAREGSGRARADCLAPSARQRSHVRARIPVRQSSPLP